MNDWERVLHNARLARAWRKRAINPHSYFDKKYSMRQARHFEELVRRYADATSCLMVTDQATVIDGVKVPTGATLIVKGQ